MFVFRRIRHGVVRPQYGPYQTGDFRSVNGRKFVGYGRLRHRTRPYTDVQGRRNDRPGIDHVLLFILLTLLDQNYVDQKN